MHVATQDQIAEAVLTLLRETDPDAAAIIAAEAHRQETTIELIASENHVSRAVMHAMGTCLTNKYAEGYPGRRYYGGCEHHDRIENLARERACQLFGCQFANVQPHSGAQANTAAFMALMEPGDTFASLILKDGGHLSHGMKINFSGTFYKPVFYPLHYDKSHPEHERIDYDAVRAVCLEHKPKVLMCGYSAYPRTIDFARFRAIADEVGAFLMADIAHIAGLVAAGVHPSPFPHAHVVTTTTHKTLRGPRGGLILCDDEELSKKINKALFPGVQGGPLMHIIGAKAVAFGEALRPEFAAYQRQVVGNAKALAAALAGLGYRITSGGTDNHLMLVDLTARDANLTGKDAEAWLERAGIITNKNGIPDDARSPMITSGLRLGSPAATTRGLREPEMIQVATWIDRVLAAGLAGESTLARESQVVRSEVENLCQRFPLGH
ncbi:MAG: serine hydroxymethyltransferase [Phycisphaeraceae bacterium]|nr:serine hydroxymethyltransferase [Phycisphaeraceae bacterium]MCW5761656.1 serine hydroxymethyltransferase [Phycisphaeraceae bacterium]